MKKCIILLVIMIFLSGAVFCESGGELTKAEVWLNSSQNEKEWFLTGVFVGMDVENIIAHDAISTLQEGDSEGVAEVEVIGDILSRSIVEFCREDFNYWVSRLNAFYYAKGNEEKGVLFALYTLLNEAMAKE